MTPSGPAPQPPPLPPPSSPGCPAGEASAVPASPPKDISRRLPPRRHLSALSLPGTPPDRFPRGCCEPSPEDGLCCWAPCSGAWPPPVGTGGPGAGGRSAGSGGTGQTAGLGPSDRGTPRRAAPRRRLWRGSVAGGERHWPAGCAGPRLRPDSASAPGRRERSGRQGLVSSRGAAGGVLNAHSRVGAGEQGGVAGAGSRTQLLTYCNKEWSARFLPLVPSSELVGEAEKVVFRKQLGYRSVQRLISRGSRDCEGFSTPASSPAVPQSSRGVCRGGGLAGHRGLPSTCQGVPDLRCERVGHPLIFKDFIFPK